MLVIFSCLLNVSEHWTYSCSLCWSWRAPLGIPHHISPQRGWRIPCLEHSRWSPQLEHACSVFFFSFFSFHLSCPFIPSSLLSHLQSRALWQSRYTPRWKCGCLAAEGFCHTKVLISVFPGTTQRIEHKLTLLDQHGEGDVGVGCVLYIWIAAAFLWTVGSVSVLMTPMFTWTTEYQGLEQDYLNMMPLKHAIAFIYDDFFFSLFEFHFCLI